MEQIKHIIVHMGDCCITIKSEPNNPIEKFLVNGEMAHVTWFRKGKEEFNGKYVVAIEYE